MAKIIKVGSQTFTPNKIANPFKTSRVSTTNPFKYNNFEGNTLPFEIAADAFQGTKTQSTNKMRMIASSVAGSMTKIKSLIPESIVNFVNRMTGYASSAWNYAKETPFSTAMSDAATSIKETSASAYKTVAEVLNTEIELNISMPKMPECITSRIGALHEGVTGIGNSMKSHWANMLAKLPSKTNYATMPVVEIENAWKEIIALEGGNI